MAKAKKPRNKKYNPIKGKNYSTMTVTNNYATDLLYQADTSKLEAKYVELLLKPLRQAVEKLKVNKGSENEHVAFVEISFQCMCLVELFLSLSISSDNDRDKLILKLQGEEDLNTLHDKLDPIIDSLRERSIKYGNNNYLTLDEVKVVDEVLIPIFTKYIDYLDSGLIFKAIKNAGTYINLTPSETPQYERYRVTYKSESIKGFKYITTHITNSHMQKNGVHVPEEIIFSH